MKQDAEFFEGRDARLLYIGRKLNDALALEAVLTEAGIHYGVEADTYRGGVIFKNDRIGAFFYVLPEMLEAARQILVGNRYVPAPDEERLPAIDTDKEKA